MTTLEMLLAHFGGVPVIPLELAAQYWGYEADTLAKKVDKGEVQVPFFRLDESQKATRLMMLTDIAAIIEERHQTACEAFAGKWQKGT
ncbi:MAG: pyocin activator PrtN family protein [Hyphomonas sp.]|uniref:pyocin activator PrtN family protein n=1 Tax=Hyphomonas sp. TaxID=87 RepID=UPI00329938CE